MSNIDEARRTSVEFNALPLAERIRLCRSYLEGERLVEKDATPAPWVGIDGAHTDDDGFQADGVNIYQREALYDRILVRRIARFDDAPSDTSHLQLYRNRDLLCLARNRFPAVLRVAGELLAAVNRCVELGGMATADEMLLLVARLLGVVKES